MCLNHPETILPPPVQGKIVFHKSSPWCHKVRDHWASREAQRLTYDPLDIAPPALVQDSNSNWAERMDLKIVSLLLIKVSQRAESQGTNEKYPEYSLTDWFLKWLCFYFLGYYSAIIIYTVTFLISCCKLTNCVNPVISRFKELSEEGTLPKIISFCVHPRRTKALWKLKVSECDQNTHSPEHI